MQFISGNLTVDLKPMRDSDLLKKNFQQICERISYAAKLANRNTQEIELLAVTKGHTAEKLKALHEIAPQLRFAENYQQELQRKIDILQDSSIRWVFIGHIQSNKLKKIVSVCEEIQTVETWEQAQIIASAAQLQGKTPYPIYLAVNFSNNPRKSGLSLSDAFQLSRHVVSRLPTLHVRGLMSIPDPLPDSDLARSLRGEAPPSYREFIAASRSVGDGYASLGMSDDLEAAVIAGSRCLRIGTALLGERPPT